VKKTFYGWWIVFACFLIAFYVGGTIIYGFTAFFEPIAEETGWSYTQISIAASLRGLEMGVFAPITGFFVDRFGPRRLIFCGTLVIGFGLLLLSQVNSLTMFYGAFGLLALGVSACAGTVLMTAVANWFEKNIGKALGIMTCGFGASGMIILFIVNLINLFPFNKFEQVLFGKFFRGLTQKLSYFVHIHPCIFHNLLTSITTDYYGSISDCTKPAKTTSKYSFQNVNESQPSFRS